jgi:hypothetical protein
VLDKEESPEVRLQIRTILMSKWDPIGVSDVPEAANEYDSYIGGVYELLESGASEERIRAHLCTIEIEAMEMVNASANHCCLTPIEALLQHHLRNSPATSVRRRQSQRIGVFSDDGFETALSESGTRGFGSACALAG